MGAGSRAAGSDLYYGEVERSVLVVPLQRPLEGY
jgi:hypothetical protein